MHNPVKKTLSVDEYHQLSTELLLEEHLKLKETMQEAEEMPLQAKTDKTTEETAAKDKTLSSNQDEEEAVVNATASKKQESVDKADKPKENMSANTADKTKETVSANAADNNANDSPGTPCESEENAPPLTEEEKELCRVRKSLQQLLGDIDPLGEFYIPALDLDRIVRRPKKALDKAPEDKSDVSTSKHVDDDQHEEEKKPDVPTTSANVDDDQHEDGEVITNYSDHLEGMDGRIAARINHWPWEEYYSRSRRWTGHANEKYKHVLYDCKPLRTPTQSRITCRKADATASDSEFIGLFLESRYYGGKDMRKPPTFDAAGQAWNAFVDNYLQGPEKWRTKLRESRSKYKQHSVAGLKVEIHRRCVEERMPCVLRQEHDCKVCGLNSPTLPESVYSDPNSTWNAVIPTDIWELFEQLEDRERDRSTNDASEYTQTQDRGRHASARRAIPKYRAWEDTHASARDTDERSARSLSRGRDDQRSRRQSSVDRHANQREAAAAEDRVPPSDLSLSPRTPEYHPEERENEDDAPMLRAQVQSLQDRLKTQENDFQVLVKDYKALLGELRDAVPTLPRFSKRARRETDKA